jgi:hypothetical protein
MPEPELTLLFTRRLNALGARYMVSGSVAVSIFGAPRLTNDVDLVLEIAPAQIARLPEVFPEKEFYLPPLEAIGAEAARDEHGHFNIIHHETGFKADIYLAGRDPLHAWALARTRTFEVAGEPFVVAPPEYVILRKLEFHREGGSEKHLRDIGTMLEVSADEIDSAELERLVEERGLRDAWRKERVADR